MKRRRILFAFVIPFFTVFALCCLLSSGTRSLSSGDTVGELTRGRVYSLSDVAAFTQPAQVDITLTDLPPEEPLALIVSALSNYSLYQGSEWIASYRETDAFMRSRVVPLLPVGTDGVLELRFALSSANNRSREILSGRLNSPPSVLLTSLESAQDYERTAYAAFLLTFGMYLFITADCLLLYFARRQEKSFLMTAIVALVLLITSTLNTAYLPFHVTHQTYYFLRPMLSVCPIIFHAAICIYLLSPQLPPRYHRLFSLRNVIGVTFAMIALQMFTSRSWYHLFHLAAYVCISAALYHTCRKNGSGGLILITGYMSCAAILFYIYIANIWRYDLDGVYFVVFRFTQLGYLLSLCACMVVINLRLIHQFKETEKLVAQVSEMNIVLDRRVAERTAQLVQAQQQKQNMMLSIFHDLRSPVFVVRGCLERLQPVDDEQSRLKSVTLSRLQVLEKLTEDLFLTEKLENHKIQLENEMLPLGPLLEEAAESLRVSLPAGVQVRVEADPGLAAWADGFRLSQAISNITDNARSHISDGGHICLSAHREDGKIRIAVEDDGSGISAQALPHVFDRFYHGVEGGSKSSGLGLYIAKELIALHGGDITAYSEPCVRTCFVITLPYVDPDNEFQESEDA